MKKIFVSLGIALCVFTIFSGVFLVGEERVAAQTDSGSWDPTGSSVNSSPTGSSVNPSPTGSSANPSPTGSSVNTPNPGIGFQLQNPLNVSTICGLIKKVLNVILGLGIPIAMLFLVYAGFMFVKAKGNPGEIKKAKENLMYIIFGTALFLGAWLLGQLVANTINQINPGTVSATNSCV
ncbi:MAG: hypothetical protein QG621_236 [Patescibacteria group bacterium]|jgi:hypothetical protein|nr:hypothetical protein [Patescibacteria group bacterium]